MQKGAVMTFRAPVLTIIAITAALIFAAVSGQTLLGQTAAQKALLLTPEKLAEQAPATFKANFETNKGPFVIQVTKDWAPLGADRFYNLVKSGFYDGNRFFYVTDRIAVFGINGDPEVAKAWLYAKIPNDKTRVKSNLRGTVHFTQSNGRKTQTAILIQDTTSLDPQATPFGEVVQGLNVVERLHSGYGEMFPTGNAPTMLHLFKGTAYLEKEFPMLDYIKTAAIAP
jgi:peptidyl-prolyl cis-trans isomerase A (cyclophilin A)